MALYQLQSKSRPTALGGDFDDHQVRVALLEAAVATGIDVSTGLRVGEEDDLLEDRLRTIGGRRAVGTFHVDLPNGEERRGITVRYSRGLELSTR